MFLAGRVHYVVGGSELQQEDPVQGTHDTTLKSCDERLRARREECVSVGVSGVEVFGDEERVGDDFTGVGIVDDGEGVYRRAIMPGAGGKRTDLLGEGLNVWILHPLGLVWDTLDVQCVSAIIFSSMIFPKQGVSPGLPRIRRPCIDTGFGGDIVKDDWRGHRGLKDT